MFFGLTNSSATFQMMMNTIFCWKVAQGWISVYMNDIMIHTKPLPNETNKQHYAWHHEYTHHVLNKLEENDLYLKPEKCAFKQEEIDYLKVIVGRGILKMDPKKVESVKSWACPKNPTQIHQFLELSLFHPRLLKNCLSTTGPHKENNSLGLGTSPKECI